MTTKYVVVPYVRVSPDDVDDLERFDTYQEAERELEHLSFLQGGFAEVVYRVEQMEIEGPHD